VFTIKSLAIANGPLPATATLATSATERADGETALTATRATSATPVAKVADVAVAAGGLPQLSAVQEAARTEVLARLESNPTVTRAFATRSEGDTLIVTLAVRGLGTCEIGISPDRFNRDTFADFGLLTRCLERPT
jgi:hypothetical protein